MTVVGHSLPKLTVRATSASPPWPCSNRWSGKDDLTEEI
jgi:hypothetical protein